MSVIGPDAQSRLGVSLTKGERGSLTLNPTAVALGLLPRFLLSAPPITRYPYHTQSEGTT
jgi:hypothetical protein